MEKRFLADETGSTLATMQLETTKTALGRLDWFPYPFILISARARAPASDDPRIAGGGSMTRRANSFKRGSVGEIELQISSPRSDSIGSPRAESPEASSAHASDSGAGGGGLHHHQNQQHLRFRLFKRPGSGAGAGEVVLGLGIRERRKLGNLMFLAFCAVCLLLGIGKIWASGWFALPGDDKNADLQNKYCP